MKPGVCYFGRCYLVVLEPEVTIFGRDDGTKQMLSYQLTLALASYLGLPGASKLMLSAIIYYINQDANFWLAKN